MSISIYLLIKLFLIGMGSAIGFLLHWLVPAIDVGVGILIGVVASGMAIHLGVTQLTGCAALYAHEPTQRKWLLDASWAYNAPTA